MGWVWIWYEGYGNNRILGIAGRDCKMNCSILVFLIGSCSRVMSTLEVQNLSSLVRANNKLRTSSLILFSTRMIGHSLNLVWQQWWGWKLHIPISNSLLYRLPLQVGSPKRKKKKEPIMELIEKVMKKSSNERKPQLLLNRIFFFKCQILLSKIFKIVDENFGLLITL